MRAPRRLVCAVVLVTLSPVLALATDAPDETAALPPQVTETRAPFGVAPNPEVQFFVRRFTGDERDVVDVWLARGQRHLAMIREVLRRFGLPENLAFLPMVESGFDPRAVSHAGAAGLWQLMASTARLLGLRVDRWVDERFDPEKSTVAAARHLRYLYERFRSWPLAQAAYNAGETTVERAMREVGSDDFWALARTQWVKPETRDFVPQVSAAVLIGGDPARYGFDVAAPAADAVATVRVPPRTSLRRLARAAGLHAGALHALNPTLVRGVTPPGAAYALHVPAGARPRVVAALARHRAGPAVAARHGRRVRAALDAHRTVRTACADCRR